MVSPPKVGDIIRMRSWHGVVLDVFKNDTGKTILRVQTVRNVFRRLNPEFIEFDLAPDMIETATTDDLQAEIENYQQFLNDSITELVECSQVNGQDESKVVAPNTSQQKFSTGLAIQGFVYIATSLDGFIARENGNLDWLPGSDGGSTDSGDDDFGFKAFMDSVDVLVMGRHTYETALSFGPWPYGSKRVVVLSSTLTQLAEDLPNTVELRACSPTELVKDLLKSGAKHLYIDGGKTIQGFLNAGLIQEIIITRIPVLIGSGIPLFGPVNKDVKLQHIETRSFTNGFVQSKYRVYE